MERRRYPSYLSSFILRVKCTPAPFLRNGAVAQFTLAFAFARRSAGPVRPCRPCIEALQFGPIPCSCPRFCGNGLAPPCFFLRFAKPFYMSSLGCECLPAGTSPAYRPAHHPLPRAPRLPLPGKSLSGCMKPARYHDMAWFSFDCEFSCRAALCAYPIPPSYGSRTQAYL